MSTNEKMRKALMAAEESLIFAIGGEPLGTHEVKALELIREALAEPAEPAVCQKCKGLGYYDEGHECDDGTMVGGNYVECEMCKPAEPAAQEPAEEAQPVAFNNDAAWELAQKVRTDLDRKSCPGFFMDLAMESINRHYTHPTPEAVRELVEAVEQFFGITRDSEGVAGYHMNGAVAEWDSFREILELEAALAKAKEHGL